MRILMIGSTGHVGRAAHAALSPKHDIVALSRSSSPRVDISDFASLTRAFAEIGTVDAVVCAAGSVPFKPLTELTEEDYRAALTGKTLSQLGVVHAALPWLREGGSITLTTGVLARQAIRTGAAASLANGAIEAFVMAAATELPSGIRINAVSPSVLSDAPGYHSAFPGFPHVSSERVGLAFVRAVEGVETGKIIALD